MKNLLLFFLVASLIYSCESDYNTNKQLQSFIPNNTSIIIKANNLESLKSNIKSNDLIQSLESYNTIGVLKSLLKPIQYIDSENEILICLAKDKNDSLYYMVITKYKDNLLNIDSLSNHTSETITTKTSSILKTTINNTTIYSKVIDSVFLGSNNASVIESAIASENKNSELEHIYSSTDKTKTVSVIINTKNDFNLNLFQSSTLNSIPLTDYLSLDFEINTNEIIFNGICKTTDSSKNLIPIFKNTIPQENEIAKISPSTIDGLMSFTFNDYKTFRNNLSVFSPITSDSLTTLFDNITEAGIIYKNSSEAIILKSIDAEITSEAINQSELIETFRETSIYKFETPDLLTNAFSPLITKQASNYININEFFIFSDDIDFLKTIISEYSNNNTLSKTNAYQNLTEHLSDESSLLLIGNASHLNSIFNSNFSEQKNINLKAYKLSAIQFITDSGFAHVNGIIKKHKNKGVSNSITETLTISIDDDLISAPQLLTNYRTRQKDIAVQDVNNNLYVYSNKGNLLFKKQLNGAILGTIEQIDIYKNGRLQLVFATPKRVYVLDRNGKDVEHFPLKFNDEITQPLSVFDYDKKKIYRLLVTQDNSLLMYDKNGKNVKGFKFKKAANTISSQPKHFRIGKKDYIIFKEGKTLQILDRIGKTRIDVKETFSFSDNAIFLYQKKFTTTTNKGDLIQINSKGQLSSIDLNLNDKHHITTTSKTLVSLSENKLSIKSKTVELDFGDYTAPKIFYINDKIYVTTTNLQSKKVYLFDSQAKSIANFPVFGNSLIELNNIDKDRNLEVVVKGENNSIIIYQIN